MSMPAQVAATGSAASARSAVEDPTGGDGANDLVSKKPNTAFFLRHHPTNWDAEDVDGVTTWLPHIGILMLVPGAHLIRTRREGEPVSATFTNATNRDENAGWIHLKHSVEIPARCLPVGANPGGYLRSLECKDPRSSEMGKYFVEVWSQPQDRVAGRPQRFVFDRAAYNRWRLWLVTSGQVPPPTDDAIAEKIATRSGRPARIAVRPYPADEMRLKRVADAELVVERMEGAAIPKVGEILPVPAKGAKARKPSKPETLS